MTIRPPRNPALSNTEPAVQTSVQKMVGQDRHATVDLDWIASEAPLEVRIDGKPVTVLMRTPGNDEELVRGFLFNEGVVSSAKDLVSVGPVHESPEDVGGSVINVQLVGSHEHPTLDRS